MIPVSLSPEPDDFDKRVRRPGLDAIAELVGDAPSRPRRGRKRSVVATKREDIPSSAFPAFWREVIPDMLERYSRLCAYLAIHIGYATGAPSVDHAIPKSKRWDLVYEWSNLRLAAHRVNARKGDTEGLVDPFTISDGWFALDLVGLQVKVGPLAPPDRVEQIERSIDVLGLNVEECCKVREEYMMWYLRGKIDLDDLETRAPFVARELRRQGRLRPGDDRAFSS